ncbi:MAG: SPFH domain-containing protein [Parabacteroides sp.]|nr:SPFH domain-containing protein [Parabacteroides sp.]MBP8759138.1 SPFH domain-containing protein [Parabacteroides sp.]MBP9480141.1 SPFH domain-containing protein [Parabacteroides sp.]MBP9578125.1 SPFH domain-containing protein [Parabacteroides sp.]MDD2415812.1 SPFH domain-containing protein [Parabacteroides sp.]
MESNERTFSGLKISGFLVLFLLFVLLGCCALLFTLETWWSTLLGILGIIKFFICLFGFMQIEPNNARVMVFFGKYKGTIKENGFFWVNPFYEKKKITLRARNLDVPPIKVNDKVGNPVMIGLVLVWKVKDTYKSMFDIDSSSLAATNIGTNDKQNPAAMNVAGAALMNRMNNFERFVKIQSDSALRSVAGLYAYDNQENGDEITLRSGNKIVNERLEEELTNRLSIAGMEVVEARINYLAYASEIAGVMLRRQQADAIIAAREKIVEGAVSMVHMALQKLEKEGVVTLDEDKKAAMVSNLLVVLCADEAAQPVINTGTLHH